MKATKIVVLMGFMMTMIGFAGQASAATFSNPKWNGYALDWCKNFEQGCGKLAADTFCQKKGYPQAAAWVKLNQVPYQTMTIGQNAICNPSVHRCDSFQSITCQQTVVNFFKPKHNGYRLDWCRNFEQNCGAPAAHAFCQKNGYAAAIAFQMEGPLSVPTMTIAQNAVCNPAHHRCDSFNYIRCKK